MKIFGFKIRKAKSLEEKLKIEPRDVREEKMYFYLKGIYDARLFGLCIYRLKPSCVFDNLFIHNVSDMFCSHCGKRKRTRSGHIDQLCECDI